MKMQKIGTYLCVIAMMFVGIISCTEDSVKATIKSTSNVTPNTMNPMAASSYVLVKANAANNFDPFTWAAPDLGFSSSITYKIQIDKASGNFTTPQEVTTVNKVLTATVTIGAFNDKLLALGLAPQAAADVKMRVVSSVSDKVAPVISSTITFKVTPYATIFPPIWGMGDALKGWGPWPDKEVEWQSSDYQVWSTITYISSTGAFRFFPQTDWGPVSYNYPYFTTVSAVFANANDSDLNFKLVAATGWYKVDVNLNTKTVTATAVAEPVLFATGDGVITSGPSWGWNAGSYLKLTYVKPGVFDLDATYNPSGAFRFFGQTDWGPDGYNYPYFTGGVDSKYVNANDGDKNLKWTGANGGAYKIRVDLNAKKVTNVP